MNVKTSIEQITPALAWIAQSEQPKRRFLRLSRPELQLKLPLYLVLVNLGFGLLLAGNTHAAFGKLYGVSLTLVPGSFVVFVQEQMISFAIVTLVIASAWILALAVVAAVYLDRLIGPTVAMRRQISELRRGNYAARISLRDPSSKLSAEFAAELNELAAALQCRELAGRCNSATST